MYRQIKRPIRLLNTHNQEDQQESSFLQLKTMMDFIVDLQQILDKTPDINLQKQLDTARNDLRSKVKILTEEGHSLPALYARFGANLLKSDILRANEQIEKSQQEGEVRVIDLLDEDQFLAQRNPDQLNERADLRQQLSNDFNIRFKNQKLPDDIQQKILNALGGKTIKKVYEAKEQQKHSQSNQNKIFAKKYRKELHARQQMISAIEEEKKAQEEEEKKAMEEEKKAIEEEKKAMEEEKKAEEAKKAEEIKNREDKLGEALKRVVAKRQMEIEEIKLRKQAASEKLSEILQNAENKRMLEAIENIKNRKAPLPEKVAALKLRVEQLENQIQQFQDEIYNLQEEQLTIKLQGAQQPDESQYQKQISEQEEEEEEKMEIASEATTNVSSAQVEEIPTFNSQEFQKFTNYKKTKGRELGVKIQQLDPAFYDQMQQKGYIIRSGVSLSKPKINQLIKEIIAKKYSGQQQTDGNQIISALKYYVTTLKQK